jgi:actin-related protein 10
MNTFTYVQGPIREEACEHLFADKLDNMRTIPELIINTILKAPIDLRKTFAGNIVLIGGTCQLKGFKKRLYDELVNLIDKNENYKFLTDCIRFHKPPCYDNYTAWLGASIYASLDINDPFNITAQKYKESDILPDWFTVCSTK